MNDVLQFLITLLAAALACVKVTLQGRATRGYVHTLPDSLWFNALMFACIALLFAVFFPMSGLDGTILLFGAFLGVNTVVGQTCYAFALNNGPVSLSVLIANFSILISSLASAIFFKEKMHLSQLVGIGFLLCSMVLSNSGKQGEAKATRRWFLMAVSVMCSFGIGNSMQKLFWLTDSSKTPGSDASLMVAMYLSASAASFIAYCLFRRGQKSPLGFKLPVIGYAAAIGATMCIYQKNHMFALENINGTFYFPTAAGLQSLLMTLIGVVLFRDRLNKPQRLGIVCGVICVALMNLKFGPTL